MSSGLLAGKTDNINHSIHLENSFARRRTSFTSIPNSKINQLDRSTTESLTSSNKKDSMSDSRSGKLMGIPTRFVKTAALVVLFIFAIVYLYPSSTSENVREWESAAKDTVKSKVEKVVDEIKPVIEKKPQVAEKPVLEKVPSDTKSSNKDDNTAETGLTTSKCSKPHSKDQQLIQYALMVDAGSTGSRIHVYRFNNCGATPELEREWFEMTAKKEGGSGLSSYPDDPEAAAKSLDVLLDVAVKHVPKSIQGCTPIAVKATAGLRKLGEAKSEAILKAVRKRLETAYPFALVSDEQGGVQVMDGKDEGVYAWITTNYLLGKIGGPDKSATAAVFDLGGGSTQIVFEPTFAEAKDGGMPEELAAGDHKNSLTFGGRTFTLYQHSYLGYGLMSARENLHKVVIDNMHKNNPDDQKWLEMPISNPCIIPGMSKMVKVPLGEKHELGTSVSVNMTGPSKNGGSSAAQCRALAEQTLLKEKECKLAPCAFNGVHQPSLAKTFAKEDVYLFSYFYDRTQPLGMPESFQLSELKELTRKVCEGPRGAGKSWDVFAGIDGAMEELMGRPDTCLDLNFMLALLHTGYEMPIDREVKIAKKIKGNELGWCLGASLPLLSQGSGWKCKVSQIA